MAPSSPRPHRSILLMAAIPVLLAGGACSSTSKDTSGVKPAEAAQTIGSVYGLSTDQISCLEKGFSANPSAQRPLGTQDTASDADLAALGEVEKACVPPETLAAAITAGAAEGLGNVTDAQKTCLTNAVVSLSDTDRTTLLVGLAVNPTLSDAQKAELGRVTNGLLDTCQLSVTGPTLAGP